MKPTPFLALSLCVLTISSLLGQATISRAGAAAPSSGPSLSPDAPPPGMVPSTSTVGSVLAAWRAAEGKAIKKVTTEVEVDSVDAYGLTGTDRTVTAGDNTRDTFTLGPTTTESGRYNSQSWRLDENGVVVFESGVHQKNEIDAQALHNAAEASSAGVTLAGEVDQPVSAYILKLNPPNGRLEWLYIDKKTSLLDREDDAYPDRRLTSTYDDYRAVNGIVEAWHTHFSDGWAANDFDVHIQSDEVGTVVADDEVQIPDSRVSVVSFPPNTAGVVLPARVDNGTIVVRVTINGRGLDFALDSGSSGILMDNEIARQLGIKTFGQSLEITAGPYQQTQAIIPEMDIGSVTLRNTYVDCVPFAQPLTFETKLVGLIGFDFIASAVIKIDYDKGSVTAIPRDAFSPPVNSIALPAALDDGVPVVEAQVGNAVGNHFILDTGSAESTLFSAFVAAHPDDVKDEGLGHFVSQYMPYVTAEGVGGILREQVLQVPSYRFGTVKFSDFVLYRTIDAPAFESEDYDGLVGYAALRFFTVMLDYKEGMVYLQPGSLLRSLQKAKPAATPQPQAT
jgi:hypothetical protein